MEGRHPRTGAPGRRDLLRGGAAAVGGIVTSMLPTAASAASDTTAQLAGGDDLLLFLDAGQAMSYSGTGTIWTDLSGQGNHATLVGAVTYGSAGAASHLVFDGSGGKTDTGPHAVAPALATLASWTVSAWARFRDDLSTRTAALVTDIYNGSTTVNFTLGTGRPNESANLTSGFYTSTGGGWLSSSGVDVTPYIDAWHLHTATYDGTTLRQFVDGAEVGTTSSPGVTTGSGGIGVRIARRWDSFQANATTSNYYAVDVAMVRIVGRALTATELTSDYVATRGRYGLG